MPIKTDKKLIEELLTRGVENIYPKREFLEERLKKGDELTIYLGIDPTGPCLHIGHAIQLMKLRQFQQLGHKVILLMGDFTGMIGDPTDKSATRKQLTYEQVRENLKNYKEQASKILDFEGENPVDVRFNNDWLGKLTFKEVIELAAEFTVQQLLVRDMFDKRMKEGKPIGLHEFLYPLMQGYDSVAMDVDVEVGGSDQIFNMLAGRTLMKSLSGKEKVVVASSLLADPTGVKMGKTEGNMITLIDSPQDMFGKVMSWTDGMILGGFELCTIVPMEEVDKIKKELEGGMNPRDAKMHLAREIVTLYYDEKAAKQAEEEFKNIFQKGGKPDEIELKKLSQTKWKLVDLLAETGLTSSKSEARRLIEQGGVRVNDEKVSDKEMEVEIKKETLLQVGKRKFLRVCSG